MKKIDLQIHTKASDGKFSPREVIDIAVKKGTKAIAITDHDTISGLDEALNYAKNKDIEMVPGVELSCYESFYGGTIDILGLFIEYENKELNRFLKNHREERIKEKKKIIEKLNYLGYEITFDELIREAGESLGRPSIARILIKKYPNEFSSVHEVFDKLIGEGKPAFVKRKNSSMKEAIEIIKKANGISILAHPGRYLNHAEKIIERFALGGGNGIEVDYPYDKILRVNSEKSRKINEKLRRIANDKRLLMSGGSDFHDAERGSDIGDAGINEEEFEILKKHRNNI